MIHPVAWLAWVGAALVTLSMTRNPLYLGLTWLWLLVANKTLQFSNKNAPIPLSPWRFALFVITLSAVFNALTVHFGATVLLRLPDILPVVGGAITLEALLYGLLNGLALSGIFTAFVVINRALPIRAIVRLIPQAFYPLAIVVSIAVTFTPATLRQFQQIREAQAARGHRLAGVRDWLPLFMPLLIGGLERALQLAEAMTARGFASSDPQAAGPRTRLAIIAGLLAVLGGWLLRLVWGQNGLGLALLLLGIGVISGTLWFIGRRIPATVYRPQPWLRRDGLVALCALGAAAAFLFDLPGLDRTSIFYYPYPRVTWPGFDRVIGLATVGLLGPAALQQGWSRLRWRRRPAARWRKASLITPNDESTQIKIRKR